MLRLGCVHHHITAQKGSRHCECPPEVAAVAAEPPGVAAVLASAPCRVVASNNVLSPCPVNS